MNGTETLMKALWRLYQHSGFAMAGAVAFAFIVSIFPFCIFLGAVAGVIGGRDLAEHAINQLFLMMPKEVAQGLAPEIDAIMGKTRIDLLTYGGGLALFFATTAIETLRAALNGAYRVTEKRPYVLCLLLSMLFVFVSSVSTIVLTWAVVVGPTLAAKFEPSWAKTVLDSTWLSVSFRYGIAAGVIGVQLLAIHLWLAAGRRTLLDVWPGVLLSILLWMGLAWAFSYYLTLSNYSRFYAGLSQVMVALIFFQVTAVVILLGAELNRGLIELRRMGLVGDDKATPSAA